MGASRLTGSKSSRAIATAIAVLLALGAVAALSRAATRYGDQASPTRSAGASAVTQRDELGGRALATAYEGSRPPTTALTADSSVVSGGSSSRQQLNPRMMIGYFDDVVVAEITVREVYTNRYNTPLGTEPTADPQRAGMLNPSGIGQYRYRTVWISVTNSYRSDRPEVTGYLVPQWPRGLNADFDPAVAGEDVNLDTLSSYPHGLVFLDQQPGGSGISDYLTEQALALSVDGEVIEPRRVLDWYQFVDGNAISIRNNRTVSIDDLRDEVVSLLSQ